MKPPSISALMYQLPQDKANHAIYGLALFVPIAFAVNPIFALASVFLIGVAKEAYDKYSGTGTPDWLDALATALGACAGFVCTLLS